jgi:cytidine deaminase
MAERSYAPYSRFHVGAAGLTDDGRVVVGCNVENGSYGLTLCAECGLVSDLHATGGGRLVAVVVRAVDSDGVGMIASPCGRCRQLLHEQGTPDLAVDFDGEARLLSDLLPFGFDLDQARSEGTELAETDVAETEAAGTEDES